MNTWSKWHNIDNFASIDKKPGVYKIRLAYSGKRHPVSISRLLGKDKDGLLSIGNSINLRKRIGEFCRVAKDMTSFLKHSAGDRLFLIRICAHSSSNTFFNDKIIQFSFLMLQNKVEAEEVEEKLLKYYFKKYGELPPLNSSMPDKHVKLWDEILLNP